MALDATVGGASANAYAEVTDGDAYFDDRLYSTDWTGASDPNKSAALIMATRLLDTLCYEGTAASSTQALAFPRSGLTTPNGYATSTTAIPRLIKEAMYELALLLLGSDITKQKDQALEGLTKLKAGSVELGFKNEITFKSVPNNILSMIPAEWICDPNEPTIGFAAM